MTFNIGKQLLNDNNNIRNRNREQNKKNFKTFHIFYHTRFLL